jgi:hypothetical protein
MTLLSPTVAGHNQELLGHALPLFYEVERLMTRYPFRGTEKSRMEEIGENEGIKSSSILRLSSDVCRPP